ncbi:hypothetical protein L3Y34_009268 [Caenorhabditis briggsae]|uniref:T20D4.11-like domain-containing protein n=2 Tax=Caenorhabditis briggsae TaxID=6238 RepID=A0AAE9D1S8_CAEBR|nr:hypothetical protein L3Y34_009268 [Caenorhabditis briggsae]
MKSRYFILIFMILFPLAFSDDSIYGCSTEDLQLTVTCRPKVNQLTEEMKKNPLNAGFPSVETLQKMSGYCKEAMACVKPAKCDAIKSRMSKFSGMCETIDFMKGPYAQCAAKLKASKDKTECIQWYFSDKSRMSTEQKCAQYKAKKSCIEKDFGKLCGDSTLKSFRENQGYVSKFVGCPVY